MNPLHTHEWKDVEVDFERLGSMAYIHWAIMGQTCDCGAKRINDGLYGWKIISEGKPSDE
jgi:hypothetical protein